MNIGYFDEIEYQSVVHKSLFRHSIYDEYNFIWTMSSISSDRVYNDVAPLSVASDSSGENRKESKEQKKQLYPVPPHGDRRDISWRVRLHARDSDRARLVRAYDTRANYALAIQVYYGLEVEAFNKYASLYN